MRKPVLVLLLTLFVVAPAEAATGQGLYGLVTRSPTKPVCSMIHRAASLPLT
ncbi:MAG: hypothetical protein H0W90_02475 [Actinobacteria bacterium]|nr:hypothetical protein [Actinomycetota bacterium]